MSGLVEGKVALVTGAAGGIGRAAALGFARQGARVAILDRDGDGAARTASEVEAQGGEAQAWAVDVTDEPRVERVIAEAVERWGRLDCAFNNAGITDAATPLAEMELDAWRHMIDVNLTSVFVCMKHEVRQMLSQPKIDDRRGAIVSTSSGAGIIAAPGLPHYTAAKHGVLGLTKCAARELYAQGVRVNAICPGSTDTPMTRAFLEASPEMTEVLRATQPGGEIGRPEDVAAAAIWLCSDQARWVSGESMLVDGSSVSR